MQLKYVGDMPIVSKNGVGFDQTQPDMYTYLQAAAELLEALSYGHTETTDHLYRAKDKSLNQDELLSLLKKHVPNLEDSFVACDTKAHAFLQELRERVHENDSLSEDEKTAWLGNIEVMKAYYYQHVTNKNVYESALAALGEEIHDGKIEEVSVPMFKNYGMVLGDLVGVLERRKPPIDSKVTIEDKEGELIGRLDIVHS